MACGGLGDDPALGQGAGGLQGAFQRHGRIAPGRDDGLGHDRGFRRRLGSRRGDDWRGGTQGLGRRGRLRHQEHQHQRYRHAVVSGVDPMPTRCNRG
ncbi:MAG: hypothetical protein EBR82_44825 [Caulobacteraceae bacterium]|nr:hypothetical protein [Caulobacteraceae bacterium]